MQDYANPMLEQSGARNYSRRLNGDGHRIVLSSRAKNIRQLIKSRKEHSPPGVVVQRDTGPARVGGGPYDYLLGDSRVSRSSGSAASSGFALSGHPM